MVDSTRLRKLPDRSTHPDRSMCPSTRLSRFEGQGTGAIWKSFHRKQRWKNNGATKINVQRNDRTTRQSHCRPRNKHHPPFTSTGEIKTTRGSPQILLHRKTIWFRRQSKKYLGDPPIFAIVQRTPSLSVGRLLRWFVEDHRDSTMR